MAKSSRTRTARAARFAPFARNAVAPPRPRDLAKCIESQPKAPTTPAEYFVQALFEPDTKCDVDAHVAGPGAHIDITIKVHVEVTQVRHVENLRRYDRSLMLCRAILRGSLWIPRLILLWPVSTRVSSREERTQRGSLLGPASIGMLMTLLCGS